MYHVVCSTDNNYAPYCGAMICSLLENNKYEFNIHIIYDSLSEENKSRLKNLIFSYNGLCTFHKVNINLKTKQVEGSRVLPDAAYYRLLLSSLMPNDIHIILYLDCDIIVLKDISYLYAIDMSEYSVAAIADLKCMPLHGKHSNDMSIPYNGIYFNSGVMLINLDYWRENDVEKKLLNVIRSKSLFFHDQDALNYVLKDTWFMLPPQACYLNLCPIELIYFKTRNDLYVYLNDIKMIHYISNIKPWHDILIYPNRKFFINYIYKTPWGKDFKKISLKNKRNPYKKILNVKLNNIYILSPYIIILLCDTLLFLLAIISFGKINYLKKKKHFTI